nr:unnamed protein product [Callosobruchus chinensis]
MHANASCHSARITQEYSNDIGVGVLEWPALIPDANPIEHVWHIIGRRIQSRVPILLNLNELQHALLEERGLIPQEEMQAIIRARGGNTCY